MKDKKKSEFWTILIGGLILCAIIYSIENKREIEYDSKRSKILNSFIITTGTFCERGQRIGATMGTKESNSYCYKINGKKYKARFFRPVPCRTSDERYLLKTEWSFPVAISNSDYNSSFPIIYPSDYNDFSLSASDEDLHIFNSLLKCTEYEKINIAD